jgi:phospholipase/carboxylesterase
MVHRPSGPPSGSSKPRGAFDELVSDIIQREGFQNGLQDVAVVGVSLALDAVTSGRWKSKRS